MYGEWIKPLLVIRFLWRIIMPFAKTVEARWMSDGKFYETGTFASTGGSTGGTVVPELTGHGLSAGIREIYSTSFYSDTNAGIAQNVPVGRANVVITTAANDTGKYEISGFGC